MKTREIVKQWQEYTAKIIVWDDGKELFLYDTCRKEVGSIEYSTEAGILCTSGVFETQTVGFEDFLDSIGWDTILTFNEMCSYMGKEYYVEEEGVIYNIMNIEENSVWIQRKQDEEGNPFHYPDRDINVSFEEFETIVQDYFTCTEQ